MISYIYILVHINCFTVNTFNIDIQCDDDRMQSEKLFTLSNETSLHYVSKFHGSLYQNPLNQTLVVFLKTDILFLT